ncbi:subtilase-type protease inhibitor [Streptomyces sp. NPDC017179]|uniref:subtilase-type protease inhibitor n=1 Tax=Streptomyces sp. NPDC017179 TaxID=3364979 RepID=UPI0037A0B678
MRNAARWAVTLGLTATAVCGPLTGPAAAALHAPSTLVLTMGHGVGAAAAAPERAVTLSCAPTPSGTHPAATEACAELQGTDGDFATLTPGGRVVCTKEYNPVVVMAEGAWQGRRVSYERTYSNECVKNASVTSVFAF